MKKNIKNEIKKNFKKQIIKEISDYNTHDIFVFIFMTMAFIFLYAFRKYIDLLIVATDLSNSLDYTTFVILFTFMILWVCSKYIDWYEKMSGITTLLLASEIILLSIGRVYYIRYVVIIYTAFICSIILLNLLKWGKNESK